MQGNSLNYLGEIQFLYTGWLWAWFATMVIVLLLLKGKRLMSFSLMPGGAGTQLFRHTRLPVLRQLHQQKIQRQSGFFLWRTWISYGIVFLGIHLALAHPYRLGPQLPTPPVLRDTVFLLDTSISMTLKDYVVDGERVDRMSMLKNVLTQFIHKLDGNRIGLMVFSEKSYTLVPLTADYDLLETMVNRLEPAILTGRSSNIGQAMLYTLQQLQKDEAHQTPTIVLVSDINRPSRDVDPRTVAAFFKDNGYRLYSIGIGTATAGVDETGKKSLIYQPVNFDLLTSIANKGGGKFYWADSSESMQMAMQAINSAERQQAQVKPEYIRISLFQWPLSLSLLWIGLLQLGPRRWWPK